MARVKGPAVCRSGYSKTVFRSGIGISASSQEGKIAYLSCSGGLGRTDPSGPACRQGPVPNAKALCISRDFILLDQDVSANCAALIGAKRLCGVILPRPQLGRQVISIPVSRSIIWVTVKLSFSGSWACGSSGYVFACADGP